MPIKMDGMLYEEMKIAPRSLMFLKRKA